MVVMSADSGQTRRSLRRCVGREVDFTLQEGKHWASFPQEYQHSVLMVRADKLPPRDCEPGNPMITIIIPIDQELDRHAIMKAQDCLTTDGRVVFGPGSAAVSDHWKQAARVSAALVEYSEKGGYTRLCTQVPTPMVLEDTNWVEPQ